eukprot:COSAG02_NODE_6438_length_3569_cov_1.642075_4_plen_77_part_01
MVAGATARRGRSGTALSPVPTITKPAHGQHEAGVPTADSGSTGEPLDEAGAGEFLKQVKTNRPCPPLSPTPARQLSQ